MRRKWLLAAAALWMVASFHGAPRAGPPKTSVVDLLIVGERTLVPGSRAAMRVTARSVLSMSESRPLPGAEVVITLAGKAKEQALYKGRSDARGTVEAAVQVPDWPLGSYKMAVALESAQGSSRVEQSVELKRSARLLLTTDKPIYQPRQSIRLRALLLGLHDLRPIKQEPVRFEVQDAKGNRVFRKELRSNAFGVVSTSFELADEINLGNYQIEAAPVRRELAEPAAKTVVVKRYVLPKFKVSLETDRAYYLPKQTVRGKIRSDYFFGKPVSGGRVLVEASTFDGVSFRKFSSVQGKTGADGSWAFDLALPDYFVGQPLLKGDALVKLEAKVTDTANHSETGIRSTPVADAPIRLAALPEGGRLVLGVENQIYVVATYPDGSPTQASISVKSGNKRIAELQTDASGLGVFNLTPREKELQQGRYLPNGSYARVLHLVLEARDAAGYTASVAKSLDGDPTTDTVLLRTDKAIYRSGDVLEATVLTSGGGPDTVFVDLIKNRQTLLTRAVYLERNRGQLRIPLGADVFGSVELHAYRIQGSGEITRDARVLYVQPASELSIEVSPDQKTYRPGGRAAIRFRVTDGNGTPQAAALGVVVVDEAVYALQEIQPGLEKVFFTLERELAQPRAQIEFAPSESLPEMIKARQLEQRRQRAAKALLAGAKPAVTPVLWDNPAERRRQVAESHHWTLQSAITSALYQPNTRIVARGAAGRWVYVADVISRLVKDGRLGAEQAKDPLGQPYTAHSIERLWPDCRAQNLIGQQELSRLWSLRSHLRGEVYRRTRNLTRLGGRSLAAHLQAAFVVAVNQAPYYALDPLGHKRTWNQVASLPGFRPEDFADEVHDQTVRQIGYGLSRLAGEHLRQKRGVYDEKRNAWALPANAIAAAVRARMLTRPQTRDLWGRAFVLRRRAQERKGYVLDHRLRFYDLVSSGPDGELGTADDLVYPRRTEDNPYQRLASALGIKAGSPFGIGRGFGREGGRLKAARMDFEDDVGGAERAAAAPMATAGAAPARDEAKPEAGTGAAHKAAPGAPQVRQVRVREYFPETLLFSPSVITDEKGEAKIDLTMADSITTWRLAASANSAGGSLGSVSQGLRVFQDFFVDLDLPVSLTQNDEVSVPVVVYNYLKQPQRVRLELQTPGWFELVGQQTRVQEIRLEPSEVRATYYRIRVRQLGRRLLEVRADGSSLSDAIRREIEVLPDGEERNLVANGRLSGTISQSVDIPQGSVADASKILVRLYPGVFSQVIEGMESMLRLPGG